MDFSKLKKIFPKFLANKYLLTIAIFALWIVFFDKANVINWLQEINNSRNMKRQREYYKREIKNTEQKLKELNSNDQSLEKYAREQFYFKNDDEDVYIIDEEKLK